MADNTQATDIGMAPVQSELKAKQQEAIKTIHELFHQQENEHEALLKEYAKLKDYLADRAVAYQTSLQQAKDLTEENDRLKMSLSSLTAVHPHDQAALTRETQKLKEDCAQMESTVENLGKQAKEKGDQIAKLKQDLDGKLISKASSPHQLGEIEKENAGFNGVAARPSITAQTSTPNTGKTEQQKEADGNSNTIRDSIAIPLLHQMVPHKPEEKDGKDLLQFLKILGSKEQELCDEILENIEMLYSVAVSQGRGCLSLLESVPLHNRVRMLIHEFYMTREELQGRSGVKVFPNLSGTAEGNRKRAMAVAEADDLASSSKRRGEIEKLVEDQKQDTQCVPN